MASEGRHSGGPGEERPADRDAPAKPAGDTTPSQAEGEREAVDENLRRQRRQRRRTEDQE
jgi:hypothetical protein